MADLTSLDALQAFHQELLALRKGLGDGSIDNEVLVQNFEQELERFWDRPKKNDKSRAALKTGTMTNSGSTTWMAFASNSLQAKSI